MTQVGEKAHAPVHQEVPEKYLHAKLIEVTFEGGYKACRQKVTVPTPHWPTKADGPNQSQRPAVFPFAHKGVQKAKVRIDIESKGYSGNGKLRGILKTLEFEGDVSLAAGKYTIETVLKEPPDGVAWFHGPMTWGIDSPDYSTLAGVALSELFFVFDDPKLMKCFEDEGVWVEALRFLFRSSKIASINREKQAVEAITRCCFDLQNRRYEIEGGASLFIPADRIRKTPKFGQFMLANYINKRYVSKLNCYDQAHAIAVLSAAVGLKVKGLFLEPFGFLALMDLVGRGPCNNPFPGDKFEFEKRNFARQKKSRLRNTDFLVVDQKDPRRSGFGNHMFCEFDGKVYDACAGPAVGDNDKLGYLRASVDTNGPAKKILDLPGGRAIDYSPYVQFGYPATDNEIASVSVPAIQLIEFGSLVKEAL